MQVKKPAFETDESVLAYMKKLDMANENTYRADSTLLVPFNGAFIILPNALVFNAKGELVDIGYPGLNKNKQEVVNACAPEFNVVVKQLCNGLKLSVLQKPNADRILSRMYNFEGKTALETVDKDYDYLVIASWGKYFGRFNKKVLNWENELQNMKGCRIKVLKLNTDPKPEWGNNWSGLKNGVFMHLKKKESSPNSETAL